MSQAASRTTQRIAVLAVLIATSLAVSGCGGAQARHDRHMQRGREYLATENLDKARIEFGNALQINPKDADALFLSGRVAERLGNIRDAVGAYQSAIDSNPEHDEARANLARVFVFAGAPDRAMEILEPALAKHPDNADLMTVRGAARVQLKDKKGALADAERAVKLAPRNENAIALLASLYRQSEDPSRAVTLVETSVKQLPESVDLRQILAGLYLAQGGREDAAQALLAEVVSLKPKVPAHRVQLALLYARRKNLDEADRVLKEGVAQMPADRQMKLAYVDFLTSQRSPAAGTAALRSYIDQDPKDVELQLALGALQTRLGDAAAAVTTYQRVVQEQEDNQQGLAARNRIAALLVQQGRIDEAQKLITEVLAKNAHDSDALILRGNLALDKGDPAAAIADLRFVLRDQPNAVGIMRVLARAHLANGEPEQAEESLRKAMTIAPNETGLRVELAQLLAQTQRVDQAVTMTEEAVLAAPQDLNAREILARMYLATNQLDRARSAAEDIKTLRPDLAVGYYISGLVAASQKRPADAERELKHALELQPAAVDALVALTRLDLVAGRAPAAIARVTAVADKNPKNAPLQNMLGELYLSQKDYAAAQARFDAARQAAPKWGIPYRNVALIRLAQNDVPGAIAAYQKGVDATSHDAGLVTDLAVLHERQGRSDDAIKLYETLVASKPRLQFAANNLAMLLVTYRKDAGSMDRARDLTASFSSSNNGSLLDTYGWVRFKRGETAEGLSALERAAELTPKSPVVRYHLGMAQLQAGEPDKARSSLESALAEAPDFVGSSEARSALQALKARAG